MKRALFPEGIYVHEDGRFTMPPVDEPVIALTADGGTYSATWDGEAWSLIPQLGWSAAEIFDVIGWTWRPAIVNMKYPYAVARLPKERSRNTPAPEWLAVIVRLSNGTTAHAVWTGLAWRFPMYRDPGEPRPLPPFSGGDIEGWCLLDDCLSTIEGRL